MGLSEYAIPEAALDEILIEKTPEYLTGSQYTLWERIGITELIMFLGFKGQSAPVCRAKWIKQRIPHVRFLVALCDPTDRAYSHIRHFIQVETSKHY